MKKDIFIENLPTTVVYKYKPATPLSPLTIFGIVDGKCIKLTQKAKGTRRVMFLPYTPEGELFDCLIWGDQSMGKVIDKGASKTECVYEFTVEGLARLALFK